MSGEQPVINDPELQAQYEKHYAVLEAHAEQILTLSEAENKRYNRPSKPLGSHILFMVAIDVSGAQYAGQEVDIRSREGHVVKPSEILEAGKALHEHYLLADTYGDIPTNPELAFYIEDTAAEAVVELADTFYNSFQIYLSDHQRGFPLVKPFLDHLKPEEISLLLESAITKFQMRYEEGRSKNITEENARIRKNLLERNKGKIFDILHDNRRSLPIILREITREYRKLATEENVRYDENDNDRTIPDELLNAYLDSFAT